MDDVKEGLKLKVDIDTELMSLKLRAIAKHATALADDLDKIDSVICPECGALMVVTELLLNNKIEQTSRDCEVCGYHEDDGSTREATQDDLDKET